MRSFVMAILFAGAALSFGCGGEVVYEESAEEVVQELGPGYTCAGLCGLKHGRCLQNATTPEQVDLCDLGLSVCLEACPPVEPPGHDT
jgi:hypothetical protein